MKRKLQRIFFVFILIFIYYGCKSIPQIGSDTSTASSPEQTQANSHTVVNPFQDNDTTQVVKLPKGILVNRGDPSSLTLIDLNGMPVTQIKTPGISFPSPDTVHVTSYISPRDVQIPLIHQTFDPESALVFNTVDQITRVMTLQNFHNLAGVPGKPVIAFSQFFPQESGSESELYLGTLENLPTTTPVVKIYDDINYLTLKPLSVEMEQDNIRGVWYTKTLWGISGDIIFPIHRGLYYYNQQTGKIEQYLDDERNPQGLALDHSLAASIEMLDDGLFSLNITHLASGENTSIALDSSSDRGGGYAVFSPDNALVAWMEASGTNLNLTPDYHSRIQVAQLAPSLKLIRDVIDTTMAQTLGYSSIFFMKPIGWLDNQSILIEVFQENWDDISLVKLEVDDGEISQLCQGNFVGFVYEKSS